MSVKLAYHDDVIKWKHFSRYWLLAFCTGNSPVTGEFPTQSQWRGAWCFLWSAPEQNGWVNNRDPSDLRRHRTHYDVTVMWSCMERSCPAPYSACRWWPLGMHAAFVRWYIRTQYKVGKTHFGKICHTPRKCIFLLKTSFRTWVSIDDITHGWLIFCVLLWFVSVVFYWYPLSVTMMTSSGGNIFRVT